MSSPSVWFPLQDEPFGLKDASRKVNLCVEHFILLNNLGSSCRELRLSPRRSPNSQEPGLWSEFVQKVNQASGRTLMDDRGRCVDDMHVHIVQSPHQPEKTTYAIIGW